MPLQAAGRVPKNLGRYARNIVLPTPAGRQAASLRDLAACLPSITLPCIVPPFHAALARLLSFLNYPLSFMHPSRAFFALRQVLRASHANSQRQPFGLVTSFGISFPPRNSFFSAF